MYYTFDSSNDSGIDRVKYHIIEYEYISSSESNDSNIEDSLNIFKETFFLFHAMTLARRQYCLSAIHIKESQNYSLY